MRNQPATTSRPVLLWTLLLCSLLSLIAGCGGANETTTREDQFGRTYYIDGAGNWGYGVADIKMGLRRAGYRGNILIFPWSPTFNPALDQTIGRPVARARGADLGKEITRYLTKFPENQVNIISLSAGTGVAAWACENVKPPAKLHSVIMLGSSLSSTYDMAKALPNVEGGIYVYHSPHDLILQGPVRTLGTIDGALGVEPAGLVGLRPPAGAQGKIRNIRWTSNYERWGWTGSHTDATSEPFVRYELSKYIVPAATTAETRRQ